MNPDIRIELTDRVDCAALAAVYRTVHAADLRLVDHTEPSVEQRLAWTAAAPGFGAALAQHDRRIVGALLGCPLPPETQWWRDLRAESDPELVREWPGRTFALCEAFVLPEYRRHRVGLALLSTLLGSRPEERVSLAVADTNTGVSRSLRLRGWEHVGDLVPFPGWRSHAMFIRPLRAATPEHGVSSPALA